MFVDELTITARAGDGGDGVVRWHREKFKPRGGPAGGNGGRGGDVYMKAVADVNRLARYVGNTQFAAGDGEDGRGTKQHGHGGADCVIEIPVGSQVVDTKRDRRFTLTEVGETVKVLDGGSGGLGNVHFKSSTNTSPQESSQGRTGESGEFAIEVSLRVHVGLIGKPNAGKSTLLNTLTNARSEIGSYPFTTLEPHLGDMEGVLLADIPGLIEGAASGKGLGHKFLRHIQNTNMLLHLISLEEEGVKNAYCTIRNELAEYDEMLLKKEEWIVLTKKDLVSEQYIATTVKSIDATDKRVFVLSAETGDGVTELRQALQQALC